MTCRSPFAAPLLLLVAAAALAACGGGPSGPTPPSGLVGCSSSPPFALSPIALTDIDVIGPLGNLAPPSHVFPSPHIGFYPPRDPATGGSRSAAVSAPGNLRIVEVLSQTAVGEFHTYHDYTLTFYPCSNLRMYFGHIAELSSQLQVAVGQLTTNCTNYSTGGFAVTQCRKDTDIGLTAGDPIGTMGGPNEGAMDFGASDDRTTLAFVNPGNYPGGGTQTHVVCAVDYFTTAARDQLRTMFGVPTRGHRTAPPVCGEVMQDVANTAQGRWFFDRTEQEDHHLALVHDLVDPSVGVISVGTSIPSLASSANFITPATGGRVDLDFKLVTADGKIYCYNLDFPRQRVLVQLMSATQLRIEGQPPQATYGTDPAAWAFSGGAVTFNR